jgi:hypothetical protein
MRSPIHSMATLCLLSAVFLWDCAGGTGEGNPEFGQLSVSLRAQGESVMAVSNPSLASQSLAKQAATDTLKVFDDDALPYFIHHIYTHVDQVEFTRPTGAPCRSNDSIGCTDTSVVIAARRLVDLLQTPSPLILENLPLPVGVYKSMKIRFANLVPESDKPIPAEYAPLVGHSILMKGVFSYGGVTNRDLSIFLAIDDLFAFENGPGLAIDSDREYNWAGVFKAGGWLRNLEIKECLDEGKIALRPDGSVVIDEKSECNELEDSLIEHVRKSAFFEIDD